jgi:hypothetical protein
MTSKTWTIGVKLGERTHQLAIREEGLRFQSRASKQKLSCGGFIVHRPCASRRAGPRRRFAVQNRTAGLSTSTARRTETRTGVFPHVGAFGIGLEYAIDQHFTVKAEYLYEFINSRGPVHTGT